ncbi:hypothetical protein AB1Y20_007142 [Prymnesium parvum]|uniref:Potassium channel domain-containing protein n=1 Tax=Prymnesium parvum TaxID=97485 RepID=A0AB34IWV0_PRYPA
MLATRRRLFATKLGWAHAMRMDIETPRIDSGELLPPARTDSHKRSREEEAALKKLLDKQLAERLIEPCRSPFSALPMLVRKADWTPEKPSYRCVLDYRALNLATVKDTSPLILGWPHRACCHVVDHTRRAEAASRRESSPKELMDAPDRQPSAEPCSPSNAGHITSERSSNSPSKASRLNPSRISMLLPNANLAVYSKRVSSEVTKRVGEKFVAPGPSQVLLLAHSIAEKGHRGLSQAAEASASLSMTSRIKLMQVLCGIVVMVHAFLLPYRAVFSMLGLDAEERALDSKYFVSFAMTLYPLDALFMFFCAAPHISHVILKRQQILAQAMLQKALSLVTPVTEAKRDCEGDTQKATSYASSDDNICPAGVGGNAKSLPTGCKRPSSAISVQQQWLESACAKSEEKAGTGAQKVAKSDHGAGPAHHAREESDLSMSMGSHAKSSPLSFSFVNFLFLVCILPWDLIPLFAGASVRTWCETQVLRVVRLYWCFPAADALAWLLRYRGHLSVARARLLSFIPLLFLVLHLITCAWQAAGDDVTGQSGWQRNDVALVGRLNDTSALYLRGIWWTSGTFVTIGFGDIVPTQLSEMSVCMLVAYFGLLTVAMIVGLLTADITATDAMASSWQQRVDTASSFARSRKLSRKVSQRIHQYLQYQWTYLRGVEEASFFVGLPAALRSEVLVALNDRLIRNIPYFATASDALIAQLAGLLFPLLFLPEECLYSEGQSAVYTSLVVRGKVQEFKYVKMLERKRTDFASCLPAELPFYALEPLPEWLPLLLLPRFFQLRHSFSLKRKLGDKLRICAPHSVLSHSMQRITLLLITVTQVGYGDIVPINLLETCVASFIALGGLLYPAVIGAIAALIEGAGRAKSKQKEEVLEFAEINLYPGKVLAQSVAYSVARHSLLPARALLPIKPQLRSPKT